VHDYPLEELGPRVFEQLAVALSLKVLGPGVEAFGAGADGGREATYDGPVNWSATSGLGSGGSWNGYVVIQAKQREFPAGSRDKRDDAAWLKGQIRDELDAWSSTKSKRGRFPQYVIFVTNARLTSVPSTGGIDSVNDYIRKRVHGDNTDSSLGELGKRGLRDWRIWHRDQLNALLTTEDGIRRAFPAMLTVGDVLARMSDLRGISDPRELHRVLTAHARNTLLTERWVNLSEAGADTRHSVEEVIIDLRADGPGRRETTALREVIARGDTVLKGSMTVPGEQRHMVLTGMPGNGKSTVARFVTQTYRAAFMAGDIPGGKARDISDGTQGALGRLGLSRPRNRRWPFRVDLADLAQDLGPSGGKSLLRWLSDKVSLRAEIDITPAALRQWLQAWPWLLVLDGLDEVTSPEVRRRITDEIEAFTESADEADADLYVVVTTRPTGYTERIAPERFAQFDLRYLDAETAAGYGRLVTSLRLAGDLDRRDQVLARFNRHLADPAMARLMQTPLQVLIMTVILERAGNLPPDRYQLFWRYYETIYDREATKNTPLASLLTLQRRTITELHEAVGLALQVHGEEKARWKAILPLPELHRLAEGRLLELGHETGPDTRALTERIVTAATKRLVLLVPAENNTVSFEIRPLQELMAGRALSNGTDEETRQRLTLTAVSPYWRNTWVFAAGRTFADGSDSRRELIVDITETIDRQPGWPGWLCPVGPELAGSLLDDGLAAAAPKWQRRLIDVALRALTGPHAREPVWLARGLTVAATGNNLLRIRNALKDALAGNPKSQAAAREIAERGNFGSLIPGMVPLDEGKNGRPGQGKSATEKPPRSRATRLDNLLRPQLSGISESPATLAKVERALAELSHVMLIPENARPALPVLADGGRYNWEGILDTLRDPDASAVLELLCGDLSPDLWPAQEIIAALAWLKLSAVPVGRHLPAVEVSAVIAPGTDGLGVNGA
jgi:hypothetical protein